MLRARNPYHTQAQSQAFSWLGTGGSTVKETSHTLFGMYEWLLCQ